MIENLYSDYHHTMFTYKSSQNIARFLQNSLGSCEAVMCDLGNEDHIEVLFEIIKSKAIEYVINNG